MNQFIVVVVGVVRECVCASCMVVCNVYMYVLIVCVSNGSQLIAVVTVSDDGVVVRR